MRSRKNYWLQSTYTSSAVSAIWNTICWSITSSRHQQRFRLLKNWCRLRLWSIFRAYGYTYCYTLKKGHPADGVYCNKEGPTQWEDSLLRLSFQRIERFTIFTVVAFEPLIIHHNKSVNLLIKAYGFFFPQFLVSTIFPHLDNCISLSRQHA